MEPFDLERAKAGDPISHKEYKGDVELRFLEKMPESKHYAVAAKFDDINEWMLRLYIADELCMKPKPIRFWVRPWKYKGGSVPVGLLWWPEEQKQPNNVSEDGTWEWAGEANLVEWP